MQEREYQIKGIEDTIVAVSTKRKVIRQLPTGGGKCLGKDTPILMYDGTIKLVQDVRIGDKLMGPDSKARRVLSTCQGVEMLYKVIPNKGEPYVVNESHILSLKCTGLASTPVYPSEDKMGNIVNISVSDYLKKCNYFKHIHKGWRAAVDFDSTYTPDIPPYLLGIWLGDGNSSTPGFATKDIEVVRAIEQYASENDSSSTILSKI